MTDNELDLLAIRNESFIREIDYHDELESTNSRAVELASTDCDTPLVVVASRQTAGRGRGGNKWWSDEGALTFTVLLDLPMLSPEQIGPFSLTTGLAVCQTLEMFAPAADLALKWPNDVYLNGKKVCGILIERPVAAEPRLAIGVGINVNNGMAAAPEDLGSTGTSMKQELGVEVSLSAVLVEFLQQLEQRTRDHVHQREALLDQWRAYCLLSGRKICVDLNGNSIAGLCRGVDSNGALLVDDGQQVHQCIAGVVTSF